MRFYLIIFILYASGFSVNAQNSLRIIQLADQSQDFALIHDSLFPPDLQQDLVADVVCSDTSLYSVAISFSDSVSGQSTSQSYQASQYLVEDGKFRFPLGSFPGVNQATGSATLRNRAGVILGMIQYPELP